MPLVAPTTSRRRWHDRPRPKMPFLERHKPDADLHARAKAACYAVQRLRWDALERADTRENAVRDLVRPTGFEPVAFGLGIRRSILLSYRGLNEL